MEKEFYRDKMNTIIGLDEDYEERVPFADYSDEEEEDPNADIKGFALTMAGWKQQRKPVKDADVFRQESKFQTQSDMASFPRIYRDCEGYKARAKKQIDKRAERNNKLI